MGPIGYQLKLTLFTVKMLSCKVLLVDNFYFC